MQWFSENTNIIFAVIFILTIIFKGRVLALIFKIKSISARELKELMAQRQITLFDVRTPSEYSQNHIPEAINIPLNQLTKEKLGQLRQNHQELVYIICASGNRSLWASISMKKAGLNPVNINGGMLFYNRV